MNWLDAALIVLAALSAASGIRHGFARSGLGLLAVLLALGGGVWFSDGDAEIFLAVFLGLLLAGGFACALIGRLLKDSGLGSADRMLGGASGLVNGFLVWFVAVLCLAAFAPPAQRNWVKGSNFAPLAIEAAFAAAEAVPEDAKARFEDGYFRLVQKLPPEFRRKAAGILPGA